MLLSSRRLFIQKGAPTVLVVMTLLLPRLVLRADDAVAQSPNLPLASAPAERASQIKILEDKANVAFRSGRYEEAGGYEEGIASLQPLVTQDDLRPLLSAVEYYLTGQSYDKAYSVAQQIMSVPAAPNSHPPSLSPGPRDYRGMAQWYMAEARRGQHRWTEALELYQLNRRTYPQDDGCVPSGWGLQRMALAEGICLENLDRLDEAVALYWPAAIRLSSGGAPIAMRRLVTLYTATGQMPVLRAAVAREKQSYTDQGIKKLGSVAKLTAEDKEDLQTDIADSGIGAFERMERFREASRRRQWDVLLFPLQVPTGSAIQPLLLRRDRIESVTALASMPRESVAVLEKALAAEPDNPWLQGALQICDAKTAQHEGIVLDATNWVWEDLQEKNEAAFASLLWQFPSPPVAPRLPASLAPVYQVK